MVVLCHVLLRQAPWSSQRKLLLARQCCICSHESVALCAKATLQIDCAVSRCKVLPASCHMQIVLCSCSVQVLCAGCSFRMAPFERSAQGASCKLLLCRCLCTFCLRKLLFACSAQVCKSISVLSACCFVQILCARGSLQVSLRKCSQVPCTSGFAHADPRSLAAIADMLSEMATATRNEHGRRLKLWVRRALRKVN